MRRVFPDKAGLPPFDANLVEHHSKRLETTETLDRRLHIRIGSRASACRYLDRLRHATLSDMIRRRAHQRHDRNSPPKHISLDVIRITPTVSARQCSLATHPGHPHRAVQYRSSVDEGRSARRWTSHLPRRDRDLPLKYWEIRRLLPLLAGKRVASDEPSPLFRRPWESATMITVNDPDDEKGMDDD